MASSEGGDEGEAVATVAPADDDRLLLKLVPVLDFVSAQLDIAATVACLNRAFRKDMGVFRAGVDDRFFAQKRVLCSLHCAHD